jgi:hypothetical protein
VGSHGVDTIDQFNMNAGFEVGQGAFGQPEYPTYGRQVATTEFWQGFSSSFHSLQGRINRRFFKGFLMSNSFTWQKAMGYNADDGGPNDFYINFARNYARESYDRTLNLVTSYSYQLPFGQGQQFLSHNIAGTIFGGWQITGVMTARTGQPLNFTGNGSIINAPSNNETPNQMAPIQILHGINVNNQWFSTSSFAEPATNTWGTMGAFGSISGPGEFRLDASIFRNILFKEGKYRAQFRMEAFNVTNTPIFGNPTTSETSGNFGYITSTVSSGTGVNGWNTLGRSMQFALKLYF